MRSLRLHASTSALGTASGGMRPVNKGVADGTVIVTTGAFHLNNERKRAELE